MDKDCEKCMDDQIHRCNDDIESKILRKLGSLSRDLGKEINNQLQYTGVYHGQHRLLMRLYHNPDLNQVMVAECLDVSPASVATMLKKLEQGGYIDRECKAEDNRVNTIHITEKGINVVDESIKVFKKIDEKAFKDFSEQEKILLMSFLERVSDNIKDREV